MVNTMISVTNALKGAGIDIKKKVFKEIYDNLGGNLRIIVSAAAPIDKKVGNWLEDIGITFLQGYGLTETAPISAVTPEYKTCVGSAGKTIVQADIKVKDPNEDGEGELLIKTPTLMIGYYEDEEETKKAIDEEGYFHSGDIGYVDDEGYVFITGRSKNVIVTQNGKNIYPEEIEMLLDKVDEIKESMVYGKKPEADSKKEEKELIITARVLPDYEKIEELHGKLSEKEIYDLMNLDDEAAQKRMNDILYGKPLAEEDVTDRSMTYQMIHASSLLTEIIEQDLNSSDPLDYIKCEAYEEILKIGEPALREFLATFAEYKVGDKLSWYIMMFACQDILGEPRRTDLTPAEWYQYYSMLDSTLAVPFRYDAMVYTSDMEKKYSLNMPSAEKDSIIAAGKDQRIKAIYDVLDEKFNKDMTLGHKVTFYAPQIFHIEENDDTMSIFAVIFDSTYVLTSTNMGYGFFERGGSVIPSRLDFVKKDGEWVLQKWTQAEDGNRYASSIEEMCKDVKNPKKLANKLISNSAGNVHMLMWQNIIYYMNAHYGGMNIPIYISSYTDTDTLEKVGKYIQVIPMFN